jgi:dTDP-4-dehydrorhamnose reductase
MENTTPGIYHFSNEGQITWFEFANATQRNGRCKLQGKSVEYSRLSNSAKRPAYSL